MSLPITNEIADQLVGLKLVHHELEGAIDESLRPVWQLNDGLLTWLSLLSESDDNYTETANHFMAISVWLERALFGHRNKPLCSKGVYKELTLLEEVIEDRAHNYVRSDVDSQQVMLNASHWWHASSEHARRAGLCHLWSHQSHQNRPGLRRNGSGVATRRMPAFRGRGNH